MKKKYISPVVEKIMVDEENNLLAGSDPNWGNNVIPSGEEEEEGGSCAKGGSFTSWDNWDDDYEF